MKRIIIQLQGGIIQSVDDIPPGYEVYVMDYDVEGADPEFCSICTDTNGDEYVEIIHGGGS